jgi:cytochrome b561
MKSSVKGRMRLRIRSLTSSEERRNLGSFMLRNTEQAWGTPAKVFHWAVAVLVFTQIGLGWAAVNWRLSPTKLDLFVWHKSIGILILLLMLARLGWRSVNVAPSLPMGMLRFERLAAHLSHVILYMLLFLMPLTGWIISSASNIPFRVFWQVPLPTIVQPDKVLADEVARVHLALFFVLALLLTLHIVAAFRHHFVKRNDVLQRMLPRRAGAG